MKIKFGIGRECINPVEPISLAGYFNTRIWNRILDDIEVRVIVFKNENEDFAIFHFDLLSISYPFYTDILEAVHQAGFTQFREENVRLSKKIIRCYLGDRHLI